MTNAYSLGKKSRPPHYFTWTQYTGCTLTVHIDCIQIMTIAKFPLFSYAQSGHLFHFLLIILKNAVIPKPQKKHLYFKRPFCICLQINRDNALSTYKMKSILSISDYRKKSCIEKSLLVCKWFNLKILYPVSHNLAHCLQLLTSSLWQCSHLLFRRILSNGSFMWLILLQENAIQRTSSLNLICMGIPEVYHLMPQPSPSKCHMVNASKTTIWISIYRCRLFFQLQEPFQCKCMFDVTHKRHSQSRTSTRIQILDEGKKRGR